MKPLNDNDDLDRILDYTEDIQAAYEALQMSSSFMLIYKEGDDWKRLFNGNLVELYTYLSLMRDQMSELVREGGGDG